jgi:type VI secretion system secreted protein Hcp
MYLEVVGKKSGKLKGESADAAHKDAIHLTGWNWGLDVPRDSAGQAYARRHHHRLEVHKKADATSPSMMSMLANNEVLKSVNLYVRKAGDKPLDYYIIRLQDASICDLLTHQDDASGLEVIEKWSFAYERIEITYVPQRPDGGGGGAVTFVDDVPHAES